MNIHDEIMLWITAGHIHRNNFISLWIPFEILNQSNSRYPHAIACKMLAHVVDATACAFTHMSSLFYSLLFWRGLTSSMWIIDGIFVSVLSAHAWDHFMTQLYGFSWNFVDSIFAHFFSIYYSTIIPISSDSHGLVTILSKPVLMDVKQNQYKFKEEKKKSLSIQKDSCRFNVNWWDLGMFLDHSTKRYDEMVE